jgi:hypothetical protein
MSSHAWLLNALELDAPRGPLDAPPEACLTAE